MLYSLALLLSSGCALAAAVPSAAASDVPDGVVKLLFNQEAATRPLSGQHARGRDVEPLLNQIYMYLAEFDLGTPGQASRALIDTGSSDLWVYSDKSGTTWPYSPSKSSTAVDLNETFFIEYVKGFAIGESYNDTLRLGGSTLVNQQFAVVDTPASPTDTGVFGIGLVANEAMSNKYSNVPASLKSQGFVHRNAYSLYLDNLQATQGSVLFGGVDAAQYDGQLYTVPLTSTTAFEVAYTLDCEDEDRPSGNAVLDSGTSFTYVNDAVYEAMLKELKINTTATADGDLLFDEIPDTHVYLDFSGAKIKLTAEALAIPTKDVYLKPPPFKYFLALASYNQSQNVELFGDSFLRSAYVVYDLDNLEVSLAQASYSDDCDIHTIPAWGPIPGAEPAPNA